MTRTRKLLAGASLLGLALTLRLGLALGSPSIFYPDEIFQTLEPAHRLVYGYGIVSWEWRLGIRSWVFPAFLSGVMRATAWMGSGAAGYLLGTTIALSLLSLTTVWFGYAWARRASGRPAALVAALACSFYFGLVYFAPKALTEVVAAHVLLPGLYLGVYGQKLGERRRLFLAGLLCALAACLRIQLLPAVAFAFLYFCYPRWRERIPALAAGAVLPVLFFGAVDWATLSYPWQSFVRYFTANLIHGPGTQFWTQPWYWYLGVLLVLIGPAAPLLFHGSRRSPFLALFCAVFVVSHSVVPHKEIRFLYPVLAPAVTLAAMGAVDLLADIGRGIRFLANPRWVVSISAAYLLASSVLLAGMCADWYQTRWGIGAFDRLGRQPGLCGIGIYDRNWWESGGYTHLHRDVPIVPLGNAGKLAGNASRIDALIAPLGAPGIPAGFNRVQCWKDVCLLERQGTCAPVPPNDELNEYLKRIGE